ncbi:MAG TPA: sigma-70 family RNA polymerase sigma factor [Longimicrobiaceae bacterium]
MDVDEVFEEHYEVLYRYLVRLTGDADQAADISQECFIRLIERRPEERQLRGWLFRVATNLVRDESRVRRRRLELLQESADPVGTGSAQIDPEAMLELKQRRQVVRRALDALSLRDRTLLLMREEGFSHKEMAVAVGTTTKSVGSMIARALNKLAVELTRPGMDP